jgi:Undecaprenyl-phosphate galactose phosphotransferase WbaP
MRGTRSGWVTSLAYFVSDATVLALSGYLGIQAVNVLGNSVFQNQFQLLLVFHAMQLLVLVARGVYTTFPNNPVLELRRVVTSQAFTAACWLAGLVAVGMWSWVPMVVIVVSSSVSALAIPFARALIRTFFSRKSWWGRRVLISGSTASVFAVARHLERQSYLGLRPVGLVDTGTFPSLEVLEDSSVPVLGHASRLGELTTEVGVDMGILVMPPQTLNECDAMMREYGTAIRHWIVMPDMGEMPSLWGNGSEVAGQPALAWGDRLCHGTQRLIKRSLDMAISLAILPVILSTMAVIYLAIRLTSKGPVFYSQQRVGQGGRMFRIWKFRTMRQGADKILEKMLEENAELRAEWKREQKLKNDPRVTWVGKFLRKASLDELPQIWNVLRGDMSLVGPRPVEKCDIERYGDYFTYYSRMTPGITGLWQISGRSNTTYSERIRLDAYYVRNWSPWLDLYILASTVKVVLKCEGAY